MGAGGSGRGVQQNVRGARTFSIPLSAVQCFACKVMGHISRNCPSKPGVNRGARMDRGGRGGGYGTARKRQLSVVEGEGRTPPSGVKSSRHEWGSNK